MRNVWIIARREYKYFFVSPIAYVVIFFFLLILGLLFYLNLRQAILQAAYQQSYAPTIQIIIGPMVTLLLFVMPAITMRSIAEEKHMGTIELLLTAPVKDWELIVGKWLGAFLFMLSLLAITWIYPIVLNFLVKPGIDQGILITGYLGLALMVAGLTAIGVFISSLFNNQIVAFFANLILVLALIFLSQLSTTASTLGNQIGTYLDFGNHFFNYFIQGTIDLSDIVYYLSVTSLALFLGTISLDIRRWR